MDARHDEMPRPASLDDKTAREWQSLADEVLSSRAERASSGVNNVLTAAFEREPQSPAAPAYRLWLADNLARDGLWVMRSPPTMRLSSLRSPRRACSKRSIPRSARCFTRPTRRRTDWRQLDGHRYVPGTRVAERRRSLPSSTRGGWRTKAVTSRRPRTFIARRAVCRRRLGTPTTRGSSRDGRSCGSRPTRRSSRHRRNAPRSYFRRRWSEATRAGSEPGELSTLRLGRSEVTRSSRPRTCSTRCVRSVAGFGRGRRQPPR